MADKKTVIINQGEGTAENVKLGSGFSDDVPAGTRLVLTSGESTPANVMLGAAEYPLTIAASFKGILPAPYPSSLRTWTYSLVQTTLAVTSAPFIQQVWPNPIVATRRMDIFNSVSMLALTAAGVGGVYTIWDKVYYPARDNARQPQANLLPLTATRFPFIPTVWPLPDAAIPFQQTVSRRNSSLLDTQTIQFPFNQYNWPTPKAYPQSLSMRGWTDWKDPDTFSTSRIAGIYTNWDRIESRPKPRQDQVRVNRLPLTDVPTTPFKPTVWPNQQSYPQTMSMRGMASFLNGDRLGVPSIGGIYSHWDRIESRPIAQQKQPAQTLLPWLDGQVAVALLTIGETFKVPAPTPLRVQSWTNHPLTSTLGLPAPVPFAQFMWRVPTQRPRDAIGWTQRPINPVPLQSPGIYTHWDRIESKPVPQQALPPQNNLALIVGPPLPPFLQADFPVPKAPAQFNRSFSQTSAFLSVTNTSLLTMAQVYQMPKAPVQTLAMRGMTDFLDPATLAPKAGGTYTVWDKFHIPARLNQPQPPANRLPMSAKPEIKPGMWPNPTAPLQQVRSFTQTSAFLTPSDITPVFPLSLGIPTLPDYSLSLRSHVRSNQFLTVAQALPFGRVPWPNPKAPQQTISMRGFGRNYGTLPYSVTGGGIYTLWDKIEITRRPETPQPPANRLPLDLTPPALPFNKYDWPLPEAPKQFNRGFAFGFRDISPTDFIPVFPVSLGSPYDPIYPASLRSWTIGVRFLSPPIKPFHQDNWPNPRRLVEAVRTIALSNTFLTPAKNTGIFTNWDRIENYPIARQNQPAQTSQAFLVPSGNIPYINADWPTPKAPYQPTRGYSQANAFLTVAQPPPPFAFTEWRVRAHNILPPVRTWTQNLQQSTLYNPPPVPYVPLIPGGGVLPHTDVATVGWGALRAYPQTVFDVSYETAPRLTASAAKPVVPVADPETERLEKYAAAAAAFDLELVLKYLEALGIDPNE